MFGYKDNSMLNKAWLQKIVFANQFISVKIKLQRIIVAWSRATSTCIMKLITGEFLLRNELGLLFRGILYHVAVSTASETMDLMYEIFKREVYNFELMHKTELLFRLVILPVDLLIFIFYNLITKSTRVCIIYYSDLWYIILLNISCSMILYI